MVCGFGAEAVAAGDLANLEAAVSGGIFGDELIEDGAEVLAQTAASLLLSFGLLSGILLRRGLGAGLGRPCLGGVCADGVFFTEDLRGCWCGCLLGDLVLYELARGLFIEGEGLLGGDDLVKLGLCLLAEKPDELGERYWFF